MLSYLFMAGQFLATLQHTRRWLKQETSSFIFTRMQCGNMQVRRSIRHDRHNGYETTAHETHPQLLLTVFRLVYITHAQVTDRGRRIAVLGILLQAKRHVVQAGKTEDCLGAAVLLASTLKVREA
jgi:hypothetical protein